MTDTVSLSFPRDPRYYGVARLVVGGLAAGLDLSFDALDDLQLAIGSLLDSEDLPVTGALLLRLDVDDDQLQASIGGFAPDSIQAAFDRSAVRGGALGLRALLDTIVDDVAIETVDGVEWVTLTKRVKAAA